jgi:prepilin-type N-terminal cleavage/methylation domain-containing protein
MKRQVGVTLIEVVVVVGIIGVLAAAAVPSVRDIMEQRRIKGFAREAAGMLQMARSEAMRTGRNHMVFFGPPGTTDPAGNPIQDAGGTSVPILILDDGLPATANCHIDGGEPIETLEAEAGVSWGVTNATVRVPIDTGGAAFSPPQASGGTFADPSNNARNWVLFRPDGIPVGVSGTATLCGTVGDTGSGGAGLYITNGKRDYAATLSPIGAMRVHGWSGGSWSQ